jgi:hypothetical protein
MRKRRRPARGSLGTLIDLFAANEFFAGPEAAGPLRILFQSPYQGYPSGH